MGCCCQLESNRSCQLDIESLSNSIQKIRPYLNIINTANDPIEITDPLQENNKHNDDSDIARRILYEGMTEDDIIEKTLNEYHKAVSESKRKKIIMPRRLDTIKETTSELSYKKSSTLDLRGLHTSFLKMKSKQYSEDTEKLSVNAEKEIYEQRMEEIQRLYKSQNFIYP